MPVDSLAGLCAADPVTALGVVVRMGSVVAAGGLASFPRLGPRIGLAAALALSAAALPAAVARGHVPQPAVLLMVGEAVVGLGLGLAVAVAFAAASWAGWILGSVAGMSWADDFSGDAATGEGGAARLASWLAVAGFLAAGGHLRPLVDELLCDADAWETRTAADSAGRNGASREIIKLLGKYKTCIFRV